MQSISADLWPTKLMLFKLGEATAHCAEIERVVLDRPIPDNFMEELRVLDLGSIENDSIAWMFDQVGEGVRSYMGSDLEMSLVARAVVLRKGCHLCTHTERDESDLAVAFWPSGGYGDDHPVNAYADGVKAPSFAIGDPSRGLCDARLPFENPATFMVTPRPGLVAIFPSHVPHSMFPYMGDKPFVHIVFQVRFASQST